ncbi:NADP-dependent oxidoreductase [Variovorax sp. J22P271]|uniref:NADP-dependent oxidoreductase n=1 Tax=Variovorax davisae TaxID=3053515 RepID=UPI002574CBB5|nr:NADP-dependent oxidoreductase [Variovorax sp. J22P271]MDM0032399.1 NADP-dependent oxidoreductase [Variovorax sp. J22P271]
MKAMQIHEYGDPEVLRVVEIAPPVPGPGQVLVRVRAAGVNPFDAKIRSGWLQAFFPLSLPQTMGGDFAGTVAALGEGAKGFDEGDRVYGMLSPMHGGTYAEYLVLDANLMRHAPRTLSFEEAAGLPMAATTAYIAVAELANVQSGQRVLVHGGAGGVGAAAIQIAKQRGAHVAATCSSGKVELVRSLGADQVIDYTQTDFRVDLQERVDVVIDPIGGETNRRSFEVLRNGGVMAVVLRNDAQEMANRAALSQQHGVTVKEVAFDLRPDLLDTLRELADTGALRPNVQTVLQLDDAAEAHRRLLAGGATGKTVLRMD